MKTPFAAATLAILVTSGVPALGNGSGDSPTPVFLVNKSKDFISQRSGLGLSALDALHVPLKKSAPETDQDAISCLNHFDDNTAARNATAICLSQTGIPTTQDFFARVHHERLLRLQRNTTHEEEQSLALLTYLEDLVRFRRHDSQLSASWFSTEGGFLQGSEILDFPFEDGDVVLGLGNSSVSALISQVTTPASRYSHAFLVRKTAAGLVTLESLIETGVKEFSAEKLQKSSYNHLTVLRWSDEATRADVARRASIFASQAAEKRLKYDGEIDFDSDDRMFCTELVAKAYAHASGMNPKEIVPEFSEIPLGGSFDFLKILGVTSSRVLSPGDLLTGDRFRVVAEFRRASQLTRAWELYLMGSLFIQKLQEGYTLRTDPRLNILTIPVMIAQMIPGVVSDDLRLIPESLDRSAFAKMATMELRIFAPAIKNLKRKGLRVGVDPIWLIHAELERFLIEDRNARRLLHSPESK